jgi:aspartate/methionine/tyrosine aminotransferase
VFSRRLPPDATPNAVSRELDALRAAAAPVVDLTESNPTRAGIPYPDALLASFGGAASYSYDPKPLGLPAARAAVAEDQGRRGVTIDPADVVLTASTSEAYSWLFKLLCDPGEAVLVPQPSYPLFEHLTALEGVRAIPYPLEYQGRWVVDCDALEAAPPGVKALLVVSPNNPTGSYLAAGELSIMTGVCRDRGWALIADEVFADYPLDAVDPLTDIACRADVLSFTLGGLSKTVGLPQLKMAWCIAGGPRAARDSALAAIELVADSYLSVGTPVQAAAAELLRGGASVRAAIQERTRRNLAALRQAAADYPSCDVLRTEGGWSSVVRVPSTRSEEEITLHLLRAEHVLVHPGYFFDFPRETYFVVSLLPGPDLFDQGVASLLRVVNS